MGRRLGQHFLRDPGILDRIVDALDPEPDDVVLEIGAGKGTLTRRLAARVGAVIAIERDPQLADAARRALTGDRAPEGAGAVRVVAADALELAWHDLVALHAPGTARCKIAGNIPYAITSPLIEKALTPPLPAAIVFLVQREVADRLASPPGGRTYGALAVGVQVAARVARLFTVRAGAFSPPPEVESAVVRLTPWDRPLIGPEDRAGFRRFVTALFAQRRKQLGRSLRAVAGLERDAAARLLAASGIDPTRRAETLDPATLVDLYRRVRTN